MIYIDVFPPVHPSLKKMSWLQIGDRLSKRLRQKSDRSIGLRFVGKEEMRIFNRTYRGKDRPTDVLSFGAKSYSWNKETKKDLGDVVICPAYAVAEAKRRHIALQEELVRLLVHGVMHLLGWNHETPEEESDMFVKQEAIVADIMQEI